MHKAIRETPSIHLILHLGNLGPDRDILQKLQILLAGLVEAGRQAVHLISHEPH